MPLRFARLLTLALMLAFLGACLSEDEPEPTPTPTSTPTPTATPSPSPTPSPTPFIPPTVAVAPDDSVQSCLERNLTPELLISLSLEQTELTEDVLRTCLETTVPSELMFLLDPLVEDASQCAVDVSQELTNQQLLALAGPDGAEKDQVVRDVARDIAGCLGDMYGLSFR